MLRGELATLIKQIKAHFPANFQDVLLRASIFQALHEQPLHMLDEVADHLRGRNKSRHRLPEG